MRKTFEIGDPVLVHGKWEGKITGQTRKHQWVVAYVKKGQALTNTFPCSQIDLVQKQPELRQAA